MNYNIKDLPRILFLDIETAPIHASYAGLPESLQKQWNKKCDSKYWREEDFDSDEQKYKTLFQSKSGIFAEFSRIVCISVGYFIVQDDKIVQFRLKSYSNEDERILLSDFCELLNNHFHNPTQHLICGHNLREFDIPFICRRLVIHEMKLPELLDVSGKKPWQVGYLLDTLEMWKFGDYKNFVSLDLLLTIFNISSSKDDMDGAQVAEVYWKEKNLQRIIKYCERDVLAVAQVFLKFQRITLLKEDQIISTSEDLN